MPSFQFDAANHVAVEAPKREPLPKGMYQVVIVESQIKNNLAGTGEYISLKLQVVDGEHSGRWIWDNLNVRNASKTAEEIAQRQLQLVCLACGVTKLNQTEELHDIPILAEVDIDRKDPTRNRVNGYAALSAGKTSTAAPKASASAAPMSSKPTARPWEKR